MNVENMPHVTVEQVLKLRKAAINLEHDNAILEAMNSKLENSLERVLNAVEGKKPTGQYDALVAMNAELVKALENTNQVLYSTIKLWNFSKSNQNDLLDCELCNENQVLIHKAKELSHEG